MGDSSRGGRFQTEMHRLRSPYYACKKTGGKKHQRFEKKGLIILETYAKINPRDI